MSASDWDIKGNAGAVVAVNRRTAERFTGTLAAFNTRVARPNDIVVGRRLTQEDLGRVLVCNSSAAITMTLQKDDDMQCSGNQRVSLCMYGTGTPGFNTVSGVTLRGTPPTLAQYGIRTVVRIGPNEWAYTP